MLIFQYLNLIGSGLRRDAGCLEIGVCNLHKLAGAQTLQGCRVAEFIENDGVICDNVSSLTIDIIDVSGIEESIFRVDIGNPTDADDGGRLWRLLYGNKVGIGLWGMLLVRREENTTLIHIPFWTQQAQIFRP